MDPMGIGIIWFFAAPKVEICFPKFWGRQVTLGPRRFPNGHLRSWHIRFDMTKSTHKFICVQILCSTCVYEYVCMGTYIYINIFNIIYIYIYTNKQYIFIQYIDTYILYSVVVSTQLKNMKKQTHLEQIVVSIPNIPETTITLCFYTWTCMRCQEKVPNIFSQIVVEHCDLLF